MAKKHHFGITVKELGLAIFIAAMGFAFSTREWLLWLNTLNPFAGLLVYYGILFVILLLLTKIGFSVGSIQFKRPVQALGGLMIIFAFFITVGFSSQYTNIVTMGSSDGVSNVYYQCEDGSIWYLWSQLISIATPLGIEIVRFLTYVITPFILALIGALLATEEDIKINPF